MSNRFDFPFIGYGLGLRSKHYPDILDVWPDIDWFEIISENFIETDGRPKRVLEKILTHYPVVMHGVSLSVGSTDPLNMIYLKRLKALADWVNPPWISDHLCYTAVLGKNSHDLLPIPYTKEALVHVVERIKKVQEFLERRILLENPSSYMEFQDSTIPESEFLAELVTQADCGVLLDLNNVYVSSFNHRLDPKTYIDTIPGDRIVQIHLAGHEHKGTHIIDTHDNFVIDEVWDLYRYTISKIGKRSTMIEWDDQIPEFKVLKAELDKAKTLADEALTLSSINPPIIDLTDPIEGRKNTGKNLHECLVTLVEGILSNDAPACTPEAWVRPKPRFSPLDQLQSYITSYRYRLFDVISEDYPCLRYTIGDEVMNKHIWNYIDTHYPSNYNIDRYSDHFLAFSKERLLPFAFDIASLERALAEIFDVTETKPLLREEFVSIHPELFMDQYLRLREASKLLAFTYPIFNYYKAFLAHEEPLPPEQHPSFMLVCRHDDAIWRLELESEEFKCLHELASGKSIGESLTATFSDITEEEEAEAMSRVQSWFSRWVDLHIFQTCHSHESALVSG